MRSGTHDFNVSLLLILQLVIAEGCARPMASAVATLVAQVRLRLHTGCVFLIHNSETDFQVATWVVQFQKRMADFNVPIVTAHPQKDIRETNCHSLVIAVAEHVAALQFTFQLHLPHAKWLLILSNATEEDFLRDVDIPVDRYVLLAKWGATVLVKEVLQGPRLKLIAEWNLTEKYVNWGISGRRNDLRNQSIQIVTALQTDKATGQLTGFYGEVWRTLEHTLGFTSEVYSGDSYGTLLPNGSWNGMMGTLVEGRAQVAVGGFAITAQRLDAVTFLAPMVEGSVTVYIRSASSDTFEPAWLWAPFSVGLRLALLSVVVLLSLGLYACQKECQHPAWFCVLASFCQQGDCPSIRRNWSARAVIVTSNLVAVVVLAAYSGTLVSFLAVSRPVLPFDSFGGLLQDGSYRLGILASSATINYFDKSDNLLMRDIFRRLVAPEMGSLPKSNAAGLHHVCARRHYAFLCPSITAAQLLPSLPCDVVPVPGASIPASSTMAVGKHSPHRRTINHCVQQMRRSGVLHRIQANTLSSPMTAVQEMRHEPVSFVTSAPLVLILSAGVAIATVLLCVERFVTRRQAIL